MKALRGEREKGTQVEAKWIFRDWNEFKFFGNLEGAIIESKLAMYPPNRNTGVLLAICSLLSAELAAQNSPISPPAPLRLLAGKEAGSKEDLTLADLEKVLQNHKSELFSKEPDLKKFSLLRDWCDALKKQPKARNLMPLVLKEIESQQPVDREPAGWDEIAVLDYGGSTGLLMDCVIAISGEEGFKKILDLVADDENPLKSRILLKQVEIRRERKKYDPVLEATRESLKSTRARATVANHLKCASAEE